MLKTQEQDIVASAPALKHAVTWPIFKATLANRSDEVKLMVKEPTPAGGGGANLTSQILKSSET